MPNGPKNKVSAILMPTLLGERVTTTFTFSFVFAMTENLYEINSYSIKGFRIVLTNAKLNIYAVMVYIMT